MHISHNASYLAPQILHNLCFSFLLGITAVLREIENNAYAKFWGQIRCIMGDVQVANCLESLLWWKAFPYYPRLDTLFFFFYKNIFYKNIEAQKFVKFQEYFKNKPETEISKKDDYFEW